MHSRYLTSWLTAVAVLMVVPAFGQVIDVGVTQIQSPNGDVDSVRSITPAARVRNYGDSTASFICVFTIDNGADMPVYTDTAPVFDLAPNNQASVEFEAWPGPRPLGYYTTFCAAVITGDANPVNDTLRDEFWSVVPAVPIDTGWVRMADVPPGPKGKKVKDGGCATEGRDATGDLIYALKGSNTLEFYAYDIATNTWTSRESVPAVNRMGKKKGVKKGASIAYDKWNAKVYATKGGGLLDLWCYDIATRTWSQKADVPAGAKTLKNGSGMLFKKNGRLGYQIFLLKGSNTTEFYVYDVATDLWATLASAPVGVSGKNFKDGSCLTDGPGYIYALKGTYNELYAYYVDTNAWTTRTGMPMTGWSGKKKKAKAGASMSETGRIIYAFKGGNTPEFWGYLADSDRWFQKPDVPIGGGKNVKGGGCLVAKGDAIYALKGNNNFEFYRYGIYNPFPLLAGDGWQNEQVMSGPDRLARFGLEVAPNPVVRFARVAYSLPKAGNIRLRLYDITGKLARTLKDGPTAPGVHSIILDLREHPGAPAAGVYLLKLESGAASLTRKLVIE